ncbi:hypothetical protein OPQ81_009289 [Rhizoctonia solani]|nr:hypothetical protein OPQ81_009289 [Rhizoctonia solani]
MGIIDRVRIPSLHATSSLPRIIASADSGVVQDNTVSAVHKPASVQEAGQSKHARCPGNSSAVDSPHDRSEDLDARYRTLPAVFNDSRTEFGKQSVRIEAETARWLALLHEIGIIFAFVRALKDVCFFKELPKTLEKH